MVGRAVRWLSIGALLLVASAQAWAQPVPSRVVAIGDVHGAAGSLAALLEHAGLIDAGRHWSGGRATLVQTGDILDRGPHVRAVLDLLMRLETEAGAVGGRVEVLLGNHETMTLTANVQDVTPAILGSFVTAASAERRAAAYREYVAYAETRRQALGHQMPGYQTRDAWMAAHPLGFVEYLDAFGPVGLYGRWLRAKPVAVTLGDTIFLHGGLSLDSEATSAAEMVARAQAEIARFDAHRRHLIERRVIVETATFPEMLAAVAHELDAWVTRLFPGPPAPGVPPPALTPDDREHLDVLIALRSLDEWSVFASDGPVWSRDFARWSEHDGAAAVATVLDRVGVRRAVVGHTVTPTRRITSRFGGRVYLIDTGMLANVYHGRPSALELSGDEATAIYLDERRALDAGQ